MFHNSCVLGTFLSRTNLWSKVDIELRSHRAMSLGYYYYILGSLTNLEDSLELGCIRASSICYCYYILCNLPNTEESMDLSRHGAARIIPRRNTPEGVPKYHGSGSGRGYKIIIENNLRTEL